MIEALFFLILIWVFLFHLDGRPLSPLELIVISIGLVVLTYRSIERNRKKGTTSVAGTSKGSSSQGVAQGGSVLKSTMRSSLSSGSGSGSSTVNQAMDGALAHDSQGSKSSSSVRASRDVSARSVSTGTVGWKASSFTTTSSSVHQQRRTQTSLDARYAQYNNLWVCEYCETLNEDRYDTCEVCGQQMGLGDWIAASQGGWTET